MSSFRPFITAAFLAALLAAPSLAPAGQAQGPAEPPRRAPDSGDAVMFDLRVGLEALSAAWRDAQDQVYAQRRGGQPRSQGDQQGPEAQWEAQYQRARQAIERAQWSQAVQQFTQLSQAWAPRADAATYWRAYSLDKMNRHAEALAAVGELFKSFPTSRWVVDARALELQVRQRSGQPVTVETGDDELKLLAIQGLQQNDPARALPLLVKVINDVGSLRLKERALFVLSQSAAPEARATIVKVATGANNNPELQVKAVQYIAMSSQPGRVTVLNNLYATASDVEVKRQVLRGFALAGDRQRVFTVAQSEKSPELRTEAVQQLGMLGARDELWQMYQKEPVVDVKRGILAALAISGATSRMIEVVTTERSPELRVSAVRHLGMMGGKAAADTLVNAYGKESDVQVRRAVIETLSFDNGNGDVLVSLARKETNPELRRELVRRLSFMRSPAAIEYLTEILNK